MLVRERTAPSARSLNRWRDDCGAAGVASSTTRVAPYTPVVERYRRCRSRPRRPAARSGVGSCSEPSRSNVGTDSNTLAPLASMSGICFRRRVEVECLGTSVPKGSESLGISARGGHRPALVQQQLGGSAAGVAAPDDQGLSRHAPPCQAYWSGLPDYAFRAVRRGVEPNRPKGVDPQEFPSEFRSGAEVVQRSLGNPFRASPLPCGTVTYSQPRLHRTDAPIAGLPPPPMGPPGRSFRTRRTSGPLGCAGGTR